MGLPRAQVQALADLGGASPGATWHMADCGCCICLHPKGDPTQGWLIGPDGSSEYHEHTGSIV